MSLIITDQASTIEFLYDSGEKVILDKDNLNLKEAGTILRKYVYVTNSSGFVNSFNEEVLKIHYSEVTSPAVASNQELIDTLLGYKASSGYTMGDVRITDGTNVLKIEDNNSMPVTIQDATTPIVMVPMSLKEQETTLSVAGVYGENIITVADPTGISAGKLLTIFDPVSVRYTVSTCVSILGSIVTLDSPLDFAYGIGSFVDVGDTNMAVTGTAANPVLFGVRNNAGVDPPPGLELSLDITRLMFTCITSTAVDLSKFADIAALTNGIVLRKRDGSTYNIFNVKRNFGLAGLMYDWNPQAATNPNQGQDGFLGRLTFAGQNKMGAVIRLPIGEDLELLVQDDLSAILELSIIAEGSLVTP